MLSDWLSAGALFFLNAHTSFMNCAETKQHKTKEVLAVFVSLIMNNFLTSERFVFTAKSETLAYSVPVFVRSIWQGLSLKFACKDLTLG